MQPDCWCPGDQVCPQTVFMSFTQRNNTKQDRNCQHMGTGGIMYQDCSSTFKFDAVFCCEQHDKFVGNVSFSMCMWFFFRCGNGCQW